MNTAVRAATLTLLAALAVPAQAKTQAVQATASARPAAVPRGGHGVLTLTLTVAPGFHIYANKPGDPDAIPTAFRPAPAPGVTFGAVRYPKASPLKTAASPKPLAVYQGRVTLTVPYTVAKTAHPGPFALGGTVTTQACDATRCLPPTTVPVRASVTVR